jgi:hypothetical protein
LATLPAYLFAELFEQVIQQLSGRKPLSLPSGWQPVYEKFTALWIADGSTLEALRKKLKVLEEESSPLGGKMMMIVEAFTHSPVRCWYSEESAANDKIWSDNLLAALPVGGLLIFDLGFLVLCYLTLLAKRKNFL